LAAIKQADDVMGKRAWDPAMMDADPLPERETN